MALNLLDKSKKLSPSSKARWRIKQVSFRNVSIKSVSISECFYLTMFLLKWTLLLTT